MDLYQKFRTQDLLNEIPSGRIVIAVSGGADSVCLLHVLKRLSNERKWEIVAAHIQHHLRGKESLADQNFTAKLSKRWSLNFEIREIRPPKTKGTEEKSRIMRYQALSEIAAKRGSGFIFTAHNANDQAETFFLNLLRGSGMDGLVGMLPSRPLSQITDDPAHSKIQAVRPLLGFSRKEILSYLKSQGLPYRTDRSNRDLKYRRNWVRHRVIPLLEKVQPKLQ